jgi:hypothetical protein
MKSKIDLNFPRKWEKPINEIFIFGRIEKKKKKWED